LKVVICDDDPLVRSVLESLVADEHHEVVGEAQDSIDAIELIESIRPDLVIVDLALRYSSGHDVVAAAKTLGCKTIVFSSFVTAEMVASSNGVVVIEKPDFDELSGAIRRLAFDADERVVDNRTRPRRSPDAKEFFAAVAEAEPGDALVLLQPGDNGALDQVFAAAERVVASTDRVAVGGSGVRMLLAASGPEGVHAVIARIKDEVGGLPGWNVRAVTITDGEAPTDAYLRLTETSTASD